jgi:hypothetical protein
MYIFGCIGKELFVGMRGVGVSPRPCDDSSPGVKVKWVASMALGHVPQARCRDVYFIIHLIKDIFYYVCIR